MFWYHLAMDIKDVKKKFQQNGLQERDSQLEMIQTAYKAIEKKGITCIEAPTGTGKTLSYCIAAYLAKKEKQHIIISTATIALQEQLVNNDLPLLARLLDEKISWSLAKGRRRHVCLAKLYQDADQGDLLVESDHKQRLKKLIENNLWDGDRDSLDKSIPEQEWSEISTDTSGCSGKRCELYSDCTFYKKRKKMHTADFIVTNHSLLLSDLELGSGVLLPEPKNNIYVIDECHHLPEKALSHFAKSTSILGAHDWINQLNKTISRAANNKEIAKDLPSKVNPCTLKLIEHLKELNTFLGQNALQFDNKIWRIDEQEIKHFESIKHILTYSSELNRYCQQIIEHLEQQYEAHEKSNPDAAEGISKRLTNFKFSATKVKNFVETWSLFLHQRLDKEAPIARWFESVEKKEAASIEYLCHCSPINVSQRLENLFWNKVQNGAVLCSATVRSLGNFDNYLRKTGLREHAGVSTAIMPSFFHYERSIVFIPKMTSEPSGKQQSAHRQEVIDLLPTLILPKAGTLILFTSRSAMLETQDNLPPELQADLIVQGAANKMKLIEKHKKRIRRGKRSILMGLASFAEGLDLPADFCQHVIIHKLPFAVPSNPIELTRSEWLEKNKLNAFMLSTLPETSIKLTQYVGRLIRQETDIGIVTILDRRLYTKAYGKNLINNLPSFQRLINTSIDDLKSQESIKHLYESELIAQ